MAYSITKTGENNNLYFRDVRNPKDRLIILTHGLAGSASSILAYEILNKLERENSCNSDLLSINSYNAENVDEFSVQSQRADILRAIDEHCVNYDEIFLVSLSYSCLAALQVNHPALSKVVLVSPSFNIAEVWKNSNNEMRFDETGEESLMNFDKYQSVGLNGDLRAEGLTYDINRVQRLIDKTRKPMYLIQGKIYLHYELDKGLDFPDNFTVDYFDDLEHFEHELTEPRWENDLVNRIFCFLM